MKIRSHTVQVRIHCMSCEGGMRARERLFFHVPVGQEGQVAMVEINEAWLDGWREVCTVSISRGDPYTIYAVEFRVGAVCSGCARVDSPLFGAVDQVLQ